MDTNTSLSVDNSVFLQNEATSHGGAIVLAQTSQVTISNSQFESNQALFSGGAVKAVTIRDGVSLSELYISEVLNTDSISIHKCKFTRNSAQKGGAISSWSSHELTITATLFTENFATIGGALYDYDNRLSIIRTSFVDNLSVSSYSHAIFFQRSVIKSLKAFIVKCQFSHYYEHVQDQFTHVNTPGENSDTFLASCSYNNAKTYNGVSQGGCGSAAQECRNAASNTPRGISSCICANNPSDFNTGTRGCPRGTEAPTYPICTTAGGYVDAETPCVFPFRINGVKYTQCLKISYVTPLSHDLPFMGEGTPPERTNTAANLDYWCPTVKEYSANVEKLRKKWGYCGISCGNPLSPTTGAPSPPTSYVSL